jgi:hypothetical protein
MVLTDFKFQIADSRLSFQFEIENLEFWRPGAHKKRAARRRLPINYSRSAEKVVIVFYALKQDQAQQSPCPEARASPAPALALERRNLVHSADGEDRRTNPTR